MFSIGGSSYEVASFATVRDPVIQFVADPGPFSNGLEGPEQRDCYRLWDVLQMLHFAAGHFQVQTFWKLWNHMPVAYGCALQITDEEPFSLCFLTRPQPSELLEQKRMVREQPDGSEHPG